LEKQIGNRITTMGKWRQRHIFSGTEDLPLKLFDSSTGFLLP
jgi:hypothetical protein